MHQREREGVPELVFETARERDLYQYYQPSFSPVAPDHPPRSSDDTALSSFAQLATLRLGTRRALISLIDRTNQYILAEATQTLSFRSDSVHNDQDELWFGCATLPRSRGLCEEALDMLDSSKSQRLSPLIISDLTQDAKFKDRPFVTSRPSLRFYAAMPITTKAGFNIGSLCVLDDKPRDGLSDFEIGFLGDMVTTIMAHLEMRRVKAEHRRSAMMVKGIGLFVEGGSTMREWWREARNDKASRQQGSKGVVETDPKPISKENTSATKNLIPEAAGHFELASNLSALRRPKLAEHSLAKTQTEPVVESPSPLAKPRDNSTAWNVGDQGTLSFLTPVSSAIPAREQEVSPISSTGEGPRPTLPAQSLRSSTGDLQEIMLSKNLKDMFSRASNIIRECIEVDGTIFLDASIGTFGGHTGESHIRPDQSGIIAGQHQGSAISSSEEDLSGGRASDAEISDVSPTGSFASLPSWNPLTDGGEEKEKMCGILGFSTAGKCSLEGHEASENYVPVKEAFLQRLLRKYPHGQVFSLGGTTKKGRGSAKQAEAVALLQMLPGARSVVLFPLWDSHRERWFAGSFAWTTQSTRILTRAEDLNYLAAFGNSIMAEVARLDAVTADRAKSDFISSISHELRSPLHGILASVQFLHDTAMDLFQNSMIDTIERCGRTLLDTIQHVLDFAKINNLTKSKWNMKQGKGPPDLESHSRRMGLSVDIDVSVITEDVINAVYAGHIFQGNSSLAVADEASGFPSEGLRSSGFSSTDTIADQPSDQPTLKKEPLVIIMDIGWRPNWIFNTQSGALRRVLMNLFGNALKYTDAGWVKISLQSKDIMPINHQSQRSIITIIISDSGRGISQEFLNSQLFTPFTQEDPMNPGTGLGLSIVLQIIRSLGGSIDVQSKPGLGTEVKSLAPDTKYKNPVMSARRKTSGLTLGLVGFHASSSIPGARAGTVKVKPELDLPLQESLENMATDWFDMKVTAPESWEASPPDIYIANENPNVANQFRRAPTIILCSDASVYRAYARSMRQGAQNSDSGLVHFVSKPCGPQKLAKAFTFCLSNASHPSTNRLPQLTPLLTPNESLSSPQSFLGASPDPAFHPREVHPRSRYFPTSIGHPLGKPSEGGGSLALGINSHKATNKRPVLLLVEDNYINMKSLVSGLMVSKLLETFAKKNNCKYGSAENDISMPVMNGMDATRAIRKLENERGQIPALIIALTGLASDSDRQEAFSSGINLFLTKPVSLSELREILNAWEPSTDAQSTGVSGRRK
ncbi:Uncharacterized protein BP5553_02623 [Venustampulla echinocandica]|uniref:histidine kinase n=1 Tax=Venustampulla echinocandica TaxID=2656787 RepID=A0A370TS09_9HELO|nr:Uncharacterized protein BP5553_02623 [Venustampulla echinocandica]RDL38283.1 Uncharacterized protein BP5553_02623 [Venustampulla echinocandica]